MAGWTVAIPNFWWPAVSGLGSQYATNPSLYANLTNQNLTPFPLTNAGGWSGNISWNLGGILSNGTQVANQQPGNFDSATDLVVLAWTGWVWQFVFIAGGLSNPAGAINNLPAPNQSIGSTVGSGLSSWPQGETHALRGPATVFGW